MMLPKDPILSKIQQQANQCVKCGLCVPHCPTYTQTQLESESPRGRIALMDGLASGQLALTTKLEMHLDQCLNCGACEKVCPSEVKYGSLIDSTRAFIRNKSTLPRSLRWLQRMIEYVVIHPAALRIAMKILNIYQKIGIGGHGHWLNKLATLPSAKISTYQRFYPAKNKEQGRVGLFTGCVAAFIDHDTIIATIDVLTHLGFGVYVPSQQTCCGALHLHAGNAEKHTQLTQQNTAVFAELPIQIVVTMATGCQAVMPQTISELQYKDIQAFLLECAWPQTVALNPLHRVVAVHVPCTLANTLQQPTLTTQLLKYIPGITLKTLTSTTHCCGAAGTYLLRHTNMAEKITTHLLNYADLTDVEVVVSCNIGCSLQLAPALKQRAPAITLMHPVQLIAKQLIKK